MVALAAAVALLDSATKLASPSYSGDGKETTPAWRVTVKGDVTAPKSEKPA